MAPSPQHYLLYHRQTNFSINIVHIFILLLAIVHTIARKCIFVVIKLLQYLQNMNRSFTRNSQIRAGKRLIFSGKYMYSIYRRKYGGKGLVWQTHRKYITCQIARAGHTLQLVRQSETILSPKNCRLTTRR